MKCPVCKNGQMEKKKIDYQTKHNNEFVIVKNVYADVCDICGEEFLDYSTIKRIEELLSKSKEAVDHIKVSVYDAAV